MFFSQLTSYPAKMAKKNFNTIHISLIKTRRNMYPVTSYSQFENVTSRQGDMVTWIDQSWSWSIQTSMRHSANMYIRHSTIDRPKFSDFTPPHFLFRLNFAWRIVLCLEANSDIARPVRWTVPEIQPRVFLLGHAAVLCLEALIFKSTKYNMVKSIPLWPTSTRHNFGTCGFPKFWIWKLIWRHTFLFVVSIPHAYQKWRIFGLKIHYILFPCYVKKIEMWFPF